MRVLVVGGSGLIGRQLVPQLAEAGHEVFVLSRGNRVVDAAAGHHLLADRKDPDALTRVLRGDFDAAIDNVAHESADAELLLSVLAGRVGHYVVTSTAFIYPGVAQAAAGPAAPLRERDWPPQALPQADDDPSPHGRYVTGKRRLEQRLVGICRKQGLPLTIVRPALQIVGPYTDDGRFAWFWLRALDGGPIWLPRVAREHAGPCQLGFSGDVARVLAAAAVRPPHGFAVYNAAQPELWSYEEYIGLMAEALGHRPDIRYLPKDALDSAPLRARLRLPPAAAVQVHARHLGRDRRARGGVDADAHLGGPHGRMGKPVLPWTLRALVPLAPGGDQLARPVSQSPAMNGFSQRSRPIVVSGPWPGWTRVPSVRRSSSARDR